ncbi:hypothetical protein PMIN06_002494 [Paraphaeosphaeria minitans]
MNEEDLDMLRNEEDAEPRRFSSWVNAHGEFQRNIEPERTVDALVDSPPSGRPLPMAGANAPPHAKETEEVASRRSSSASSSSSVSSSSTTHAPRLEEIRTHDASSARERRDTFSSAGGGSGILYRHPTERHPEALSRIETIRSQHAGTVGARQTAPSRITRTLSRRRSEKPLSEMGANKPYPPPLPDREEYVVEFMGVDDPLHAQNWPMKKKLYIAALMAYLSLAVAMGSSIFSPSTRPVAEEFGVITEVTSLATSFFVFGYAFGPLVWAPMSELYGRKLPLLIGSFGFSVFSLAVSVGKDLQTVLISRFFAGLFGACPLSVVAAVYADIFNNVQRGIAIGAFSATVFMGPMVSSTLRLLHLQLISDDTDGTLHWWLHSDKSSWLEVDHVYFLNYGLACFRTDCSVHGRDISPANSCWKSCRAAKADFELGNPREARGNRGRSQRAHCPQCEQAVAHPVHRTHRLTHHHLHVVCLRHPVLLPHRIHTRL